ncbi:MAG: N-acetyltransferase [Candidatus Kapabacteria bacterium]|jgi:hypothetical protein|nr:N-acetyltransferase [Candidatus Kapabacteria bacterium]
MTIHHQHSTTSGSWYIEENTERLAALDYAVLPDGTFSLDSTQVDDRLRGKGAGKQLVEASVRYARANNLKLKPVCPFVVALFDKMPQWSDVRA